MPLDVFGKFFVNGNELLYESVIPSDFSQSGHYHAITPTWHDFLEEFLCNRFLDGSPKGPQSRGDRIVPRFSRKFWSGRENLFGSFGSVIGLTGRGHVAKCYLAWPSIIVPIDPVALILDIMVVCVFQQLIQEHQVMRENDDLPIRTLLN